MPIKKGDQLLCDWCESQVGEIDDEGRPVAFGSPGSLDLEDPGHIDEVDGMRRGEHGGIKTKVDCDNCGYPNVFQFRG